MDLDARMAVVENEVHALKEESMRTRGRLHDLESDRATLRLLSERIGEFAASFEKIATATAEKAVTLALESRDAIRDRRTGIRTQMISVAVGAAIAVVAILIGHHH